MKRRPFFEVGGEIFVDILFNWDDPLPITTNDLARLVRQVGSERLIIGRRLTAAESRRVASTIDDAASEAFALLMTRDDHRWRDGGK